MSLTEGTLPHTQIFFLPDFSIGNLLNIINSGFSVTEKLSNEDINEITETSQLLSIDIKELYNDEKVPHSGET